MFISTNDLVWYCPLVSGGKIAARVLGDINFETQECTIEITARSNPRYPRGTIIYNATPTVVFRRGHWGKVTFAPKWLIYWFNTLPKITRTYHHGNDYRQRELTVWELVNDIRKEIETNNNLPTWFHAGPVDGGVSFVANSVEGALTRFRDHKRLERGWTTWELSE